MAAPDSQKQRRTRILVVDGEVIMRRALSDVLAEDPGLEVLGTAARGAIAVAKAVQLTPDLVLLHSHLPDGSLEALCTLRKQQPGVKVLILHAECLRPERGLVEGFFNQGVTEYAVRPASLGIDLYKELRERLLPRIRELCALNAPSPDSSQGYRARLGRFSRDWPCAELKSDIRAVLIASSTGGPRALDIILPALPALDVPILIVQHMPPVFTRALAERMTARCAFPVVEARSGHLIEPGKCWVAPGDFHLSVVRRGSQVETHIHQSPPENSVRPAADVLFRSAAEVWGGDVLAVVLTGMGQDGWRGTEQIVRAGGQVIAQDEATSVVWGMPGFVAQSGLADAILPIHDIAREIRRRVTARVRAPLTSARQ